jgi:hypothetical protein
MRKAILTVFFTAIIFSCTSNKSESDKKGLNTIMFIAPFISAGILCVQIFVLRLQIRSKRWRLIITAGGGASDNPRRFIIMQSINLGERTIALRDFFIQFHIPKESIIGRRIANLTNKFRPRSWLREYSVFQENLIVTIPPFPIILEPGRSCEIKLNGDNILENLKANIKIRDFNKSPTTAEIRGVFHDETNKEYISSKVMIDLETGLIW